ncbi:S8 family peptidase [Flavihumibacter sp. ZG627]|uniref:S8 family peptidase n=1 Tax=Flavihumibacter sp. ZG627 TaxID=1463156 RepID=UPI00057F704F|nr:S8 family peptidase [Flavihumibacter sp. ZG627]KIC89138.1 hypothetical protein HY58_18465 [Flavihumibacter sp. ZG627]
MKNLPIKIFQKRKITDDRNPEGGGSNELPQWARLSEQELEQRTTSMIQTLDAATEWLENRGEAKEFIPAVLKLEIQEKAIAKSHRGDIAKIFNVNDEQNVIGMINSNQLLVKVNSVNDVQGIKNNINVPERHLKGIAAITEISQFRADVDIDEDRVDDTPLRASLINYQNFQLNNAVCRVFEFECERLGVDFRKVNYTPELIVYRLSNTTSDSLEKLQSFEALETLAVMPTIAVSLDDLTDSIADSIPVKFPEEGKEYPTIGVLDSGIRDIPHLKPWLLSDSFSKVPDDLKDERHGTFVAGILVYGDQLNSSHIVGNPGCYLFDAAVIPDEKKDRIEEADLIENIREAISTNKDIKIWNLSLGTKTEAERNAFSFFGMALDQIQLENDVLICKSAGNCTNFKHGYPVSRIAKSADSVLSLVVGSIAHEKNSFDLSEVNHPSPFSRIGHGPAYIHKPELSHIGGNAGIHPHGYTVYSGVRSFTPDGRIATNIGTSFSTPRVSSLIAGVSNVINEPFSPLLLKALAVHSAKYPTGLMLPPEERLKTMGYGIPDNVANILYNDPHEITLILQDTLEKGHWIQILDFPFPANMVHNGMHYGEVVITLATLPMFAEKQGGEYCQSNLEVRFGTHEGVRQTERPRNPVTHQSGQNLLRGALYGAGYRKGVSDGFACERTLVQYGDKFHPIKKYAINLEEMTPANAANHLTAPKQWYLEIEGLFRDYICGRCVEDGIALSQDFCLIITIRDSKKQVNVYNTVSNLLSTRGFVHNNISLKSDVRVDVRRGV